MAITITEFQVNYRARFVESYDWIILILRRMHERGENLYCEISEPKLFSFVAWAAKSELLIFRTKRDARNIGESFREVFKICFLLPPNELPRQIHILWIYIETCVRVKKPIRRNNFSANDHANIAKLFIALPCIAGSARNRLYTRDVGETQTVLTKKRIS